MDLIQESRAILDVSDEDIERARSQNRIDVAIEQFDVIEVRDIVYKQAFCGYFNDALKLDLLLPQAGHDNPLVVDIPGGGFYESRSQYGVLHRIALAKAGFAVAIVQHRFLPQVTMPEPIEDVRAAVRFLRANASQFGIDPKSVGAMGDSAGGYFAALLGLGNDGDRFDTGEHLEESSHVSAVVDLYGVTDLSMIGAGYPDKVFKTHLSPACPEALILNGMPFYDDVNDVLVEGGSVFDSDPDRLKEFSPLTYVDGDSADFLFIHGDDDPLVSPYSTYALHEKLLGKGCDSQRVVIRGAKHGGAEFIQPVIVDMIVDFFKTRLM